MTDVSGPMPEANSALNIEPEIGIVFCPGAKIDPRSYAPFARAIAREGILVLITPMPLNLAVISPNRATDFIGSFSDIQKWVGRTFLGWSNGSIL